MAKKSLRVSLLSCILVVATLVGSTVAYAAGPLETLKSGTLEETLNGMVYSYYSEINRFDCGVSAKTYVGTKNGQYVPADTIGVRTGLYNYSGQLCKQTRWATNSYRATGMSALSGDYNITGVYYAMGDVKIYSGNDWEEYTSLQTGTVSYTSSNGIKSSQPLLELETEGYKTNSNNMTYGSGLGKFIFGKAPDLVSVVGLNGRSGYVYQDELDVERTSLSGKVIETNDPVRVPVYMEDGVTLVDYFEIEKGNIDIY
jgi:hypothetical protein